MSKEIPQEKRQLEKVIHSSIRINVLFNCITYLKNRPNKKCPYQNLPCDLKLTLKINGGSFYTSHQKSKGEYLITFSHSKIFL